MVHKLPKVPLRAGRWPCPVIGENELESMTEAHAREGEELEVASDRRALGGIHHGSSPYRPRRLGRRALVSRAPTAPHLTLSEASGATYDPQTEVPVFGGG